MTNMDAAKADDRATMANQIKDQPQTLASYSLSSPELRHAVGQMSPQKLAADMPPLLKAPDAKTPEIPSLLKAPAAPAKDFLEIPVISKSVTSEQPVKPALSAPPPEPLEDKKKTIDPCTKLIFDPLPAPSDVPKPLDLVKDRDPELYNQIKDRVVDPRYTGELGNITVSTHDAKGRVDGCVFEQNVPYWESGPAVQALEEVKKDIAKKGKTLNADHLNGAGRTLGQEEAINWRNSGVHAKVGKSNHGPGKAEDFDYDPDPKAKQQPWEDHFVNATLHAHGWRQGDSFGPIKNDQHHWSFVGPFPVSDGHPPSPKHHSKHHKHR